MKFSVIEADPPWTYRTWSEKGDRINGGHYKTMAFERLQNLDVLSLAEPDCVLFLWVTAPLLKEGIATGEAWGFTYKSIGFSWVKRNKNVDSWAIGQGLTATRGNVELCLTFTRGKPERLHKGVGQVLCDESPDEFLMPDSPALVGKRLRHSAKPLELYENIEKLFVGPYLRLFARDGREGWVSLGDEVTGRDVVEDITLLGGL